MWVLCGELVTILYWLLGGVWSNSLIGCFYWRSLQTFNCLPNVSTKWDCLMSINFFPLMFPSCPYCSYAQSQLPMLRCIHSSAGTSALSNASLPCLWHGQAFVCSFLTFSPWKVKAANVLFYGCLIPLRTVIGLKQWMLIRKMKRENFKFLALLYNNMLWTKSFWVCRKYCLCEHPNWCQVSEF